MKQVVLSSDSQQRLVAVEDNHVGIRNEMTKGWWRKTGHVATFEVWEYEEPEADAS